MRSKKLTAEQIAALALHIPWKDTESPARAVARWAAANLVLLEDDCPHCGQSADECDDNPCDQRAEEIIDAQARAEERNVWKVVEPEPEEQELPGDEP